VDVQKKRIQTKWLIMNMLVMSIVFFFLSSLSVDAHSALVKTEPKANEEPKAPDNVELWFQDPVVIQSDSITVINEAGDEVQEGNTFKDSNPRHVTVLLKKNLSPGRYTVKYNVIALDGYVLQDDYQFKIAETSGSAGDQVKLRSKKTKPADGKIVQSSPKQIELWFTQPARVTAVGVYDDQQQVVPTKEPVVDPDNPRHVIIKLQEKLSPGSYRVDWYAAPTETNEGGLNLEWQGIFYFAVDKVTSMPPDQGKPVNYWLSSLGISVLAYWLSFIGLLTLFGGIWFNVVIAKYKGYQPRWKKISLWLYIIGIIGFILLVIQNRFEFPLLSFKELVTLKFTWIPALQIILFSLGYWLKKDKLRLSVLGVTVLLWPFASGHSSYPRYGGWLSMGIDVVHLLGVAIWMGGLLALLLMMPKEKPVAWLKETGSTYSRWAFWSLIAIILSGISMSLMFVPSFTWDSLLISNWGKSVLVKLALVVIVIVSLGFWQKHSLKKMNSTKKISFIGRAGIELLTAAMILLAAGMLIEASPIAAVEGVFPKTVEKHGIEASVNVSPFQIGTNDITIQFENEPNFKQVHVKFFMPPDWFSEYDAFSLGNGKYKLTGSFMHASGSLYMDVEAIKSNGEKVVFPFRIVVPGEIRPYD
jgi:copper transport protein